MDGSVVSQYDNVSCENFISLHCLQGLCVCLSTYSPSPHRLCACAPATGHLWGGGRVGAQGDQMRVVPVASGAIWDASE